MGDNALIVAATTSTPRAQGGLVTHFGPRAIYAMDKGRRQAKEQERRAMPQDAKNEVDCLK